MARGVVVHPISALDASSLNAINNYLSLGVTIGIFGSSGVGKSALVNALLGSSQLATNDVRGKDSKDQ